ncbi:Glyoxalase/Bleomycin resistance protein/Dihydroxybiphenyl dioxygenase [Boeremia exigua]|uniref:Glyoxalase/Bleomycin resistance protein/Dihydroxybiphenyl dioxygenase n=1 Tax=Boeremia exigua TaxID=749465 RepID=UPI001E8E6000|nr:Glyoxalase/Bleomycin resistance protein/Dihydroxybiphenyl dioxygenase [Boeremia exigua]KAH6629363.1 Glyoxalase/Bleomycin resistance protein/Dihydroxybiphenyl dioxygenase [Boeremia exigua]
MASFSVKSIDHVVLTARDIPKTIEFYTQRLGMKHEVFSANGGERHALSFGSQKLNLHQSGKEFEPKAENVQPGSEDLCFITDYPVDDVLKSWQANGIEILEGGKVVDRTGAQGKLRSVYCRDPDGNLIE